jgi:hypothetical protein
MDFLDRLLGKPTPDGFAEKLRQALGEAGDPRTFRYGRDGFRLVATEDGEEVGVINLGNLYKQYQDQPSSERKEHLRRSALALGKTKWRVLPDDYEVAKPNLRPKLWSRGGLAEHDREQMAKTGKRAFFDAINYFPVGDHLVGTVAYDWPEATQSIAPEQFEKWGVTVYEAMEDARQNLAAIRFTRGVIGDKADTGQLTIFQEGDNYDAARLLMVDVIRDMPVRGRHVAMVPNRDQLYLTGSDDEIGLKIMIDLAEHGLADQSYGLSMVPLILDDDVWLDWMPPVDHPLHQRFRELKNNWLGPEYADQKEHLDKIHERNGVDIFVASFSGIRNKADNRLVTYCVWSAGVDTLLPETDLVAFCQSGVEETVAFGPWERVREAAGELMERTEHYPTRWRVREFPAPEALERIGNDGFGE